MDKTMARQHLVQAERHVAQGERHIREQRARIERAERAGLDTTEAQALLQTFEATQALHVSDRDRIRAELDSR
jgi:predicted DsbA family dithiol-disulfide isomerase